jgi:cobalamin biosynthesis protein CobD/CbiB
MAATTTKPTKNQIELQRLENDLQVRLRVVQGVNLVLVVLASALPLYMLKEAVEPFAGKETVVNANVVVSVTFALSVMVNIAQYVKGASRKRRLKESRQRADELERRLGVQTGGES